jgi:hypothetical protein
MNGEVDVLHVMRMASAILIRDGHKAAPEDLLDAHDAVNRLIGVCRHIQNRVAEGETPSTKDWDDFDAALSRLTGAA